MSYDRRLRFIYGEVETIEGSFFVILYFLEEDLRILAVIVGGVGTMDDFQSFMNLWQDSHVVVIDICAARSHVSVDRSRSGHRIVRLGDARSTDDDLGGGGGRLSVWYFALGANHQAA